MFVKLSRYKNGYVRIKAKGFAVERFINLAVHNDINIWDLSRNGSIITFCTKVKDFKKLSGFARKSGVHLKIIQKSGCPFLINKYKHRYIFFAGFLIFAALLCYMSSFIWFIEVKGNTTIEDYQILSVLSKNGLETGSFKYTLNLKELEQNVKNELTSVGWINIKVDGTKATVTISEKLPEIRNVENSQPCDIISDKEALVTEIMASSGKPMVKPGDIVEVGDTLISADITYLQDGIDVVYGQVQASGYVRGDVRRTITINVPYTLKLKRYTSNSENFYSVKLFNIDFNTNFIKNDVSFQKYDIIREIEQPQLGDNFILPIIFEKLSYLEYKDETIKVSAEEAKQICMKKLNKQIIEQYPADSDIIDKQYTFSESSEGITLNAVVVSNELIGKVSYIVPTKIDQGGNAVNGTTENTNSE